MTESVSELLSFDLLFKIGNWKWKIEIKSLFIYSKI